MNKFMDYYDYQLLIDDNKYARRKAEIKEIGDSYYHLLCVEFGVMTRRHIQYGFFRNLAGRYTAAFCSEELRYLFIGISLGHMAVEPGEVLEYTVPHEIAHAFLYTIYPKNSIQHGQEWQDIMRLLKLDIAPTREISMLEGASMSKYEQSL